MSFLLFLSRSLSTLSLSPPSPKQSPATQDGALVQFKTKKTTQLKKLMKAYCERMNLQVGSTRFMFDGERIQEGQTPNELGLEDGDQIDAMVEQLGGGGGGGSGEV